MLSKTHRLVEAITTALGPIFREHPDYSTIQQAMGLVIARVAMATPEIYTERRQIEVMYEYSKQALIEFLKLEEEEAAKKALLDAGIGKFAKMFADKPELGLAAINGGMGTEAQAAAEEMAASENDLRDYYQNRIDLEDMAARKERRKIKAEEAEQAWKDTLKEDQ